MTDGCSVPDALAASWRNVAVRYPYAKRNAVGPVSFDLKRGERLLLLGSSGSGKSTLLNTLTGLVPHAIPAERQGSIRLDQEDVSTRPPAGWASHVARFFQNAEETLCGMRVEDEIAFALENRGLPEKEIAARVSAALRLVGLPEDWRERRSSTLSGGEKQLVALAACFAQEAPIFVADEPTAHLSPAMAARLHRLLMDAQEERSVFLVDHRLDGLITSVDRVVVLDRAGLILADGQPASVFRAHRKKLQELGVWLPLAAELDGALEKVDLTTQEPPLTLEAALDGIDAKHAMPVVHDFVARHMVRKAPASTGEVVARLVAADCAPLYGPTVLRNVTLTIRQGEVLGILGANGAGKSTLGASLAGLLRLKAGKREGRPGGIAFQNSENQFIASSVGEEIFTALPRGISEPKQRVDQVLREFDLAHLRDQHPFQLSQGQKRRLSLATLTAAGQWPLFILDEPTAGLDAHGVAMVVALIEQLAQQGHAIAAITHDMDLALRLCPRSIIVANGGIIADGPTVDHLNNPDLLAQAGLAPPAIAPALAWLKRHAAC